MNKIIEYLYTKISLYVTTQIALSIFAISVLLYWAFFSDSLKDRIKRKKQKEIDIENIKKISLIKMVSDDRKEIENFISSNVEILPTDIIVKLVERIEVIKSDKLLFDESNKKFDKLENNDSRNLCKK